MNNLQGAKVPNNFKTSLPTRKEFMAMTPLESSKRIVAIFKEAAEELRRQGIRPTLEAQAELVGSSSSTYQGAINHLRAVELYGISPNLNKNEAIRRLKLMEPAVKRLGAKLDDVKDSRSDPEILADAVSALVIQASQELPKYDVGVIRGFLMRDPQKRGSTKSALIDLVRWLVSLERDL
jgi:hypothetical protein